MHKRLNKINKRLNELKDKENQESSEEEEQEQIIDYAIQELIEIRDALKKCITVEEKEQVEGFGFFIRGGSGQCYTPKHVELMREIKALGGKFYGFTGGMNKYRDSALLLAAIHKDYEFIRFLMENGADPTEKHYNGSCAFDYVDKKEFAIIF